MFVIVYSSYHLTLSSKQFWLYSQNYAAGKRWYNVYYQESSDCVEYPPKIPTKIKPPP